MLPLLAFSLFNNSSHQKSYNVDNVNSMNCWIKKSRTEEAPRIDEFKLSLHITTILRLGTNTTVCLFLFAAENEKRWLFAFFGFCVLAFVTKKWSPRRAKGEIPPPHGRTAWKWAFLRVSMYSYDSIMQPSQPESTLSNSKTTFCNKIACFKSLQELLTNGSAEPRENGSF